MRYSKIKTVFKISSGVNVSYLFGAICAVSDKSRWRGANPAALCVFAGSAFGFFGQVRFWGRQLLAGGRALFLSACFFLTRHFKQTAIYRA